MRRELISSLHCPYCLGGFKLSASLEGDVQTVDYGLLRCKCFEFPIIEGVLLLNLAKAYGGAEEDLQPYGPLQAASVVFMKQSKLDELKEWIRSQIPLLGILLKGQRCCSYAEYVRHYDQRLRSAVASFLTQQGQYGIVGSRSPLAPDDIPIIKNWYLSRFITPRAACLRDQIARLHPHGRILSTCAGHGIAEHLLQAQVSPESIVSVDAQVLNLLVTKTFINPRGTFICHDVQFPLPFHSDSFNLTIASTCLPEIPCHANVIRELVRVTNTSGNIVLDNLWADPLHRIAPLRYYRFLQNEFESLHAIFDLIRSCSDNRPITLFCVAKNGTVCWSTDLVTIEDTLDHSPDPFISLIIGATDIDFAAQSKLTPREVASLQLNPLYTHEIRSDTEIFCQLACERGRVGPLLPPGVRYLPASAVLNRRRLDDEVYVSELYRQGVLVSLPEQFGIRPVSLWELQTGAESVRGQTTDPSLYA